MDKQKRELQIYCEFNESQIDFQKLLEKVFMEYLQEKNV